MALQYCRVKTWCTVYIYYYNDDNIDNINNIINNNNNNNKIHIDNFGDDFESLSDDDFNTINNNNLDVDDG